MPGLPRTHLLVLLALALANVCLQLGSFDFDLPDTISAALPAPTQHSFDYRRQTITLAAPVQRSPRWRSSVVKPGDTLSEIFTRARIRSSSLIGVSTTAAGNSELRSIRPGQTVFLLADETGELLGLRYAKTKLETLTLQRVGREFKTHRVVRVPERRIASRAADIDTSLFIAGQSVGLDDRMTMALAQVFQWDIDFALDIRKGDSFAVIYEELVIDGEVIGHGDILAAQFINQGQRYEAVRYATANGDSEFYASDGRAMRKAFLRTPLEFSRISSNFNMTRFHPILKRVRPHLGTDYAAPTGTPIWAAGDGKVVDASYNSSQGNHVMIKHGDHYETHYFHMSRIASGIAKGQRVKQGQVIGYVGMTGLATGPHLHFEFFADGKPQNPRTVSLMADPIPKREMPQFLAGTQRWIAALDQTRVTQIARAEAPTPARH